MRYCEVSDCIPVPEKNVGVCCKDCPRKNDCDYACGSYNDNKKCIFELEDKKESH